MDVELLRPHGEPTRIQISLSRPSHSLKHLWSLLRSRLERVDLGEGVEGVVMIARRTSRLRHQQNISRVLGGSDDQMTASAWGELLDTLVGRLSADNVVNIGPVESYLPERAFQERSVMELPGRGPSAAAIAADRPTILFSRPEPADAMALTPDGPILSIGWRGRRWKIIACFGPERIGQEWWRWEPCEQATKGNEVRIKRRSSSHRRLVAPMPADRDYFVAETESGRTLWVCRHVGTSRWFVHGEWS